MISDIKTDLFRKTQYMEGGSLTDPPSSMIYESVVGYVIMMIAFLVSALNNLDITAWDIQNAYLNEETKERVSSVMGINGNLMKGKWLFLYDVCMG